MNRLILCLILVFTYVLIFGQTSQICGKVGDPTGNCPGFAGVTVVITNENGDILCETTTSVGGIYCCTINNSEFPIKICPKVKCPFDYNGISTLDLALIQKFILGLPNPSSPDGKWSPFFRLWADANGDGKVTASDLVLLRKYIVGIIQDPTTINICRIISEKCKLQFGSDPYNYQFCLNGCEFVDGPNSGNVNFEIFNIGDVNNTITDSDCTKPLQDDGGEENFRIPNSHSLVYNLNPDKSTSIGFDSYQQLSFLNLSIAIGNLGYQDLVFLINDAEYIIKDGVLHVSYFSQTKNQVLDVKDILIVKDRDADFQYLVSNSVFINNRGDIFGINGNQTKKARRNSLTNATVSENSGNLFLNLDDNLEIDDNSVITIYNTVGELVSRTQIHGKNIEKRIEVGNLNHPNGMYILNIQNSKGNILLSKKFVITK